MKRICSLVIAALIILQSVVFAENAEIKNIRLTFEGTKILVSADAGAADSEYAMMVVRDGGSVKNPADVFAVREAKSGSDGIVSFTFKMPEEKDGKKTDGRYVIYMKGKNTGRASHVFDYVTEPGKIEALEKVANAESAGALKEYFAAESSIRAALVSSGFIFDDYDLFSDNEKTEVCRLMKDNMKKDSLSADFKFSVPLAKINLADKISEWIIKTEIKFENISFEQSEAKDFIEKFLVSKRVFDKFEDYNNAYTAANAFYLCNNAKYNEIYDILSKYSDVLGVDNSSECKKYFALTGNAKQAADEAIVTYLKRNNAADSDGIEKAVSAGIAAAAKAGQSGQDSSGSQGSGNTITIGKKPQTEDPGSRPENEISGFTDLVSVPWAEAAIKELFQREIVSGVGDGLFNPKGIVTREAFVKMLVAALGIHDESMQSDFYDVEKGAWYDSYIASAHKKGIVNGMGDNLFGVGKEITRQDVAVMTASCMELAESEEKFVFADDSDISEYAKDAVYKLYSAGIISGMEDKSFMPQGNCTRAQAAVIIYNMINYSSTEPGKTGDKENSAYSAQIKMLSAFGFLKGIDAENFDENNYMIRQKFITAVAAMAQNDELTDAQAVEYAKSAGIINSENYDLNGNITYDEAAEILVNILGYTSIYSGRDAVSIASEIGLLKNTKRTENKPARAGDVVQMLYNALDIPLITVSSSSADGIKAEINKDDTILSVCHNIFEVKGIVTQNEDTALTGVSTAGKNGIELNGVLYSAGESGAENFLGMNVKAYVRQSSRTEDENEVVYIEEYRDTVTEIPAELLEEVSDTAVKYYQSEDMEKSKTVKISPVVKVIYNGRAYAEYNAEDLKIESGTLRLIDNDNNGTADVIFIEEYFFMVVDSVSAVNETVYNIYSNPESLVIEDDDKVEIYLNGEEIEYTDMDKNYILAVMQSKDKSERIIKVRASDKTVEGMVSGINTGENEISIDGKDYKLSPGYISAKNNNDEKLTEIERGNRYKFYLDDFGEIVYLDRSSSSEYEYVYARKFEYNDGDIENTLALRYMNTKGAWESAKFAEKVRVKGESNSKTREEVFNLLQKEGVFAEQLFRVKKNSAGEINTIETAEERKTYIDDSFNKRTVESNLIWGVNNFSFDSQIFCFADTYVFRIPQETGKSENDYAVTGRSLFVADGGYRFTAYDLDEYNYAKAIVISQSSSIQSGTAPFVVADIGWQEVNGEVLPSLTGFIGENTEYTVIGESENIFDGVGKGDVIQLGVNINGMAVKYNMLYSVENSYGEKINPDKINQNAANVAGYITNIDRAGNRIKIDNGLEGGLTLLKDSAAKIALYDVKRGTVEEASMNELEKGDYLFARLGWSKVKIILVIRK